MARSDVFAASTDGECAIWACKFKGRPVGEDWMIFCRSGRTPSGASAIVRVGIRLTGITSSWLVECVSSRLSGDGGHFGQRGADCSVGSFQSEGDALDCN